MHELATGSSGVACPTLAETAPWEITSSSTAIRTADARLDLVEDDALRAVGGLRVDLHAAVDRPGVHDDGVELASLQDPLVAGRRCARTLAVLGMKRAGEPLRSGCRSVISTSAPRRASPTRDVKRAVGPSDSTSRVARKSVPRAAEADLLAPERVRAGARSTERRGVQNVAEDGNDQDLRRSACRAFGSVNASRRACVGARGPRRRRSRSTPSCALPRSQARPTLGAARRSRPPGAPRGSAPCRAASRPSLRSCVCGLTLIRRRRRGACQPPRTTSASASTTRRTGRRSERSVKDARVLRVGSGEGETSAAPPEHGEGCPPLESAAHPRRRRNFRHEDAFSRPVGDTTLSPGLARAFSVTRRPHRPTTRSGGAPGRPRRSTLRV